MPKPIIAKLAGSKAGILTLKGAPKALPVPAGVARALQLLLPALAIVRITLGFCGEWLTMMANVASEGRLFSLKASEWFVLLASVAFCGGFLTLIF
jgi:hypothetical protein